MIEKNTLWEQKVNKIKHKNYLIDPQDYREINFQTIENKSKKVKVESLSSPQKNNLFKNEEESDNHKTLLELP